MNVGGSFFGVTFQPTNMTDRKRCDWCKRIVCILDCETHALGRHNVPARDVRIEPGTVIG